MFIPVCFFSIFKDEIFSYFAKEICKIYIEPLGELVELLAHCVALRANMLPKFLVKTVKDLLS